MEENTSREGEQDFLGQEKRYPTLMYIFCFHADIWWSQSDIWESFTTLVKAFLSESFSQQVPFWCPSIVSSVHTQNQVIAHSSSQSCWQTLVFSKRLTSEIARIEPVNSTCYSPRSMERFTKQMLPAQSSIANFCLMNP